MGEVGVSCTDYLPSDPSLRRPREGMGEVATICRIAVRGSGIYEGPVSCPSLLRSLSSLSLAVVVVVLGPPLGAGCGSDEEGIEVKVQAAPLPGSLRSFTTDRGYVVTLNRAAVSFEGLELQACAQSRRAPLLGRGVAWAHSTASPTRLGDSFVLGLSGGTLALGTLPPPPGRYCGVRLALAPADGDAMGLPDTSMEGLSIRLEGFFQMPGQEPTPLGVSTTMAASAPASLALTLGDDGQRSATLTVRLSGEHWLDGIDLATASADELSQAVVKAVAGSLTVDAS